MHPKQVDNIRKAIIKINSIFKNGGHFVTEPNYPFLFEWHQLGQHSALLQWNKPTQPNGILMGYNIYYSEMKDFGIDDKTTINYFIQGPNTVQTKLTGLKQGKKYQVNIGAVNCAGESEQYVKIRIFPFI